MTLRHDPIKLTLALGFTAVLTLMGLISVISLTQLKNTTTELSELFNETKAKISAANAMRDNIRLRGDILFKMYITDDYIKRDELRIEFGVYAMRYKEARDKLYSYPMSAREAKLLDELMKQTRDSKGLNDLAADNLLSDLPDDQIRKMMETANDSRHGMLLGLDNLVALQDQITTQKIDDAITYQNNLGYIILYLSLTAILIAIYIAQLVIREATRKNSEIHYQATHDDLTRLYNRKEFKLRLFQAYKSIPENRHSHVLCFMDLDKFKVVNDTCGHKAGDRLLVDITQLVKNYIRSHDTFARLGGDEFGLLLENCTLEKATELCEGIVGLVRNHQFHWNDSIYQIGVSIGIVAINKNTRNIDQALNEADIACYIAKDLGRNRVHIHGDSGQAATKVHDELNWVSGIDHQDEQRFTLYLQGIYSVQGQADRNMYEILLRLNDDEGRLVTPGKYMPAAERFSMMRKVDHWVIEHAIRHLANTLKRQPGIDITLFINISSNSLIDDDLANHVSELQQLYNLPPRSICLEIAEEKAIKNLDQLKNIVIKARMHDILFALDDFGTGMASFSYLKDLPVDFIKIKGAIVKNLAHSSTDRAMVAAIAKIGEMLNIRTVGKHVEDAFTLNQLKSLNIDYAQGYYLGKPQPVEDCLGSLKPTERLSQSSQ